jgi:hypothetical protein
MPGSASLSLACHQGLANAAVLCFALCQICTDSNFELIVMLLIFGNGISLALYNPMEPADSLHNETLAKVGAQRVAAAGSLQPLRAVELSSIPAA